MKFFIPTSICLLTLTSTAFAAGPASSGTLYLGAFGGGGWSSSYNMSQYGTAFYTEADGGPLAVNAFGNIERESSTFFGLQLGYRAPDIFLNTASSWSLSPAVELEGFAFSNTTFDGSLANNTDRAPEHTFSVSYPMSRTLFLGNAVIGLNNPRWVVHPYVGFGIGSAIMRISGATATQTSPPEANINHYNSNPNDSNSAFAGQIKVGLSYDINSSVSLFADYRWVYIASTNFTFGSTVYPSTHVPTSPWQVNMDAQRYNLANIGVRVNFQ